MLTDWDEDAACLTPTLCCYLITKLLTEYTASLSEPHNNMLFSMSMEFTGRESAGISSVTLSFWWEMLEANHGLANPDVGAPETMDRRLLLSAPPPAPAPVVEKFMLLSITGS